ncbi:beta-galactosidase [Pontiellaceae bacterium B12227]|nr:beta-galactosidase [Pontiellaceae bacterium B12227]
MSFHQSRRNFVGTVAAGGTLFPMLGKAETAEWKGLVRRVEAKQEDLAGMISAARRKKCVVDYAIVSHQVISIYQVAAKHDYENMDRVREIFKTVWYYSKIDPVHTERIAYTELEACLDIADYAMNELRQQMARQIKLLAPPDLTTGQTRLASRAYEQDGKPIFPSSLVWTPAKTEELNAFGRIGGGYLQISMLNEDLKPGRNMEARKKSLAEQDRLHMAPRVFLSGHSAAGWMKKTHPEILYGGRNFTQYDIDSPLIREWVSTLYSQFLPEYGKACGDAPMMHLLANEPHFATRKGGWKANNGLSDHTMEKWQRSLEAKYQTIDALNAVYGTEHTDWDQVLFHRLEPLQRQIDKRLRGTPLWYDWVRFNHDRVNEWFSFLKTEAQKNDGGRNAPASIKVLGFSLSKSERSGGMDMEYLTDLQDVLGADLRCAPAGANFFGKHEEGMDPETGWQAHFAYDWSEQSMFLDFSKSICPDKVFYDSEWHGFGAVSWRHFHMSRDYVRSALWLAFSHGMGMIKAWLWGRGADGALSPKADHIGELSTQPIAVEAFGRTLKELNAHAGHVVSVLPEKRDFWIYYCEESAIQDPEYTHGFKQVYEALKMLNYSVGFTTPSKIGRLDPATQTVIVSPTRFVSDRSLDQLKSFAGRIVLVGGEESFLKTEQGIERSNVWKLAAFAEVPMADWIDLVPALESALAPVASVPLVPLQITDTGGRDSFGVSVLESKDPKSGRTVLVLNNISKDRRLVTLPDNARTADLITQQRCSNRMVMDPCAVRLIMVA